MRPVRSVSVLMPTWQGIEFLRRVLESLERQELGLSWDFRAIDSGSTDGTWELLGEFQARFPVPFVRERIDQVEFDHGDTRNLLAARSRGDLLVFLTQDAIPIGSDWLAKLASNFEDPRVGAAYCRNLPRPDAELLTRAFSAADPGYAAGRRAVRIEDRAAYEGLSAHEKRLLHNFNDVASAIRRELWELHPFPRTEFGEDVLMARALLEAGSTIVYDDAAAVEHSHDYDARAWRARGRIDGRFNAEWLDRVCVGSRKDAQVLARRQLESDRAALEAAGLRGAELERELGRALALREAVFLGLWEGGRTTRRRPRTRVRARRELSVLYVVHGFPPHTWAGTEVYTLNLARAMQARGHRVAILARAPARPGGPPDFALEEGEHEGLRVLRLTYGLAQTRLSDSYRKLEVEEVFRGLLLREGPDLVHFQHLIHLSAGLVQVAREAGLPTVLHCHDYWAICARVQLIRPDGRRCERNMGSGCYLCVKETGLSWIERLAASESVTGPITDALLSEAGGAGLPRALRPIGEELLDLRARRAFVEGAYKSADLCISPSRFLRKKLVETAGFDPHRLIYSDNGMRSDHVRALEKRPDPEGRVRFGFVGTLVWYKGGRVLLEAMRILAQRRGPAGARALLDLHGDFRPDQDPHHAELAALAQGLAVRFRGRFDNARLSAVYSEIDVLVVPSIWFENSPITIHEAHLTRTPVIASDIGGMAEYVRDGVDGLHFRTEDAADLARVMARLLDEPELLGKLARDFPPLKSIEENAAELEFRYRALCCVERDAGRRTSPPRVQEVHA